MNDMEGESALDRDDIELQQVYEKLHNAIWSSALALAREVEFSLDKDIERELAAGAGAVPGLLEEIKTDQEEISSILSKLQGTKANTTEFESLRAGLSGYVAPILLRSRKRRSHATAFASISEKQVGKVGAVLNTRLLEVFVKPGERLHLRDFLQVEYEHDGKYS